MSESAVPTSENNAVHPSSDDLLPELPDLSTMLQDQSDNYADMGPLISPTSGLIINGDDGGFPDGSESAMVTGFDPSFMMHP